MKLLVTGTAGFIGSQLALALLGEGHEVLGIDSFNAYYPTVLKRARHALLEKHATYRGFERDLTDYDFLLDLVKREQPAVICHLAAQAGVRHSINRPFDYEKANLAAFLNILEVCRHGGVKRLVYASSSSVYGNSRKLPFSEDDAVDRPISLYAATKKSNELMAHCYTHLYGVQTIGLRFFTVYGPWGRPDMANWLFADAITHGEPIKVFNHGQMKRDFTYIDDIVAGVSAAIFRDGLDPFEIINLGNHRAELLLDMIDEMGRQFGVEPQKILLPMQPGDVDATYADISRAQKKLGFEPRTPMREGIARFATWFKENRELTEAVRNAR